MMWNDLDTGACEGMIAETISLRGHGGDTIRAYYSRPLYADSCPSIVLIPHMPGWDEYCREAARRFTQHNYAVLCPDIYARFGTGKPAEVAMKAREAGGEHLAEHHRRGLRARDEKLHRTGALFGRHIRRDHLPVEQNDHIQREYHYISIEEILRLIDSDDLDSLIDRDGEYLGGAFR